MPANLTSRLILTATLAWDQIIQLGPYVVSGILLAALLGQLDLPHRWRNWLHQGNPATVVGAACLGSVSPLCTYGTVPVLMEFLRGGASPGAATTFLVASSLLNPQLFAMMTGGLGLPLALAHAAGVLLLSVPVGLLARQLRPGAFLNKQVLSNPPTPTPIPPYLPNEEGKREQGERKRLSHLLRLTETIGLYFVTGVILAALLQTLVPREWISSLLGASRWYSVPLAGLLGVPLYACGGGAVPLMAGLLTLGMSPGAALAFFLAGPATRLTSLAALGTLLNRQALAAYVIYVVAGATLAGLALNLALGV
jgi:uncharacterized membrane protein YraQ (UPF0718 family)